MGHTGQLGKLMNNAWGVDLKPLWMAGVIGTCIVVHQLATAAERAAETREPSLNVVVEAPEEVKQEVEKALTQQDSSAPPQLEFKGRPTPHQPSRVEGFGDQEVSAPWRIQVVKPSTAFDYKILRVQPDEKTQYRIQVIDPKTLKEDPELSGYLQDTLPKLLERQRGKTPSAESVPEQSQDSEGRH